MIKAAFAATSATATAIILWATLDTIQVFARDMATLTLQAAKVCGAVGVFVVAVACVWWIARQRHESMRQRDGAFALRQYNLVPWTVRLLNTLRGLPSPVAIYDHGANPGAYAIIADAVYMPTVTAEQYAYAADIEKTHRVQAALPGDGVRGMLWHRPERNAMNAPTARLMAGAYDKQPKPQLQAPKDEPAQLAPVARIDLEQALRQTSGNNWPLGQNKETGELAILQPDSYPHIAVVGSSGSGKTESSMFHLVTAARRNKWHAILLDPVGGADLGKFRNHVEWHESGPDVFADQLKAIDGMMTNRRQLCAQAGVPRIAELPDAPQQVLVMVDEFGLLMASLTGASKATAERILSDMVRAGRKWGVHLALCDQDKTQWPESVGKGITPTLTYRMADHAGAGTKAFAADTLATGDFVMARRLYSAWHVAPQLDRILAVMPAQKVRMIDGSAVRSLAPDMSSTTSSELPNEPANEPCPTELQLAAWAWMDANPDGKQVEMRTALGMSKGYASECWNTHPRWKGVAIGENEAISIEQLRSAGVPISFVGGDGKAWGYDEKGERKPSK